MTGDQQLQALRETYKKLSALFEETIKLRKAAEALMDQASKVMAQAGKAVLDVEAARPDGGGKLDNWRGGKEKELDIY
jgi:hypothetical protein